MLPTRSSICWWKTSRWELTTGLQIRDGLGNDYGRPKNVVGESRTAFTSHADGAFDVCFENILDDGIPPPRSHPRLAPPKPLLSTRYGYRLVRDCYRFLSDLTLW